MYKKQGKPVNDPNSDRRITISNINGKLVEKLYLDSVAGMLNTAQNRLQRGFTKDVSPGFGLLLLTEAIVESVDVGKPLYIAFIDACKAFDVVWHDLMLVKLHDACLQGRKWTFLSNWYQGLESLVKWEGKLSTAFCEKQGVQQGGILSPTAYMHFLNPVLNCIAENNVGLQIGSIYSGLVAVADDVLFMADDTEDLQCQLHVQSEYAKRPDYMVLMALTLRYYCHCGKRI